MPSPALYLTDRMSLTGLTACRLVHELVTRKELHEWTTSGLIKLLLNWGRTNVLCLWSEGGNQRLWFVSVIGVFIWALLILGYPVLTPTPEASRPLAPIVFFVFFCNWTGLFEWFPVWPYFAPANGHCMIFNGFGCKSPDIWLGSWSFVYQSVCESPSLVILTVWLNGTENRGVICWVVPISA